MFGVLLFSNYNGEKHYSRTKQKGRLESKSCLKGGLNYFVAKISVNACVFAVIKGLLLKLMRLK